MSLLGAVITIVSIQRGRVDGERFAAINFACDHRVRMKIHAAVWRGELTSLPFWTAVLVAALVAWLGCSI